MSWAYRFDGRALKELKKLGHSAHRDIIAYLDERVAGDADPRRFGKGLKADLAGLWRYRVGDYRILCQIKDRELLVLVVAVGHRRDVYE
ncbi:MAG: type II toxin-antitoxin system RelE/ParE family toxin [Terrimicrobiaceae bacterium]